MRVAIVHYWLIDRRGGERVIESLCALYPEADIYTNVYVPEAFESSPISNHRVHTTAINSLPAAATHIAEYLPLMPIALGSLNLKGYDFVISSESGPAKGVRVGTARHLCYCHSPMRYIWDMLPLYVSGVPRWKQPLMRSAAMWLRHWDVRSARLPHRILANSRHTRARVNSYWKREADVLFPPVEIDRFNPLHRSVNAGSYYLYAGSLTGYKRPDLAVEACTALGVPLVVAGTGPELQNLRRTAGPTVKFTGWINDAELGQLLAGATALLHPGEEDFGILPVEAMAAGCPVIAYARGGALDTVVDGSTGVLFEEQSLRALSQAIARFESGKECFTPTALREHVQQFDRVSFLRQFAAVAADLITGDQGDRGRIRA